MSNLKFKVADSDILRFYPAVDYEIPTGVTPVATPVATPVKTPSSQRNCDSASSK